MTSEPRAFELFHTAGCHLCELACELLAPIASREIWEIELVDIADDDVLLERYGLRIPVLRDLASGAELGWPFDADAVRVAFSR